MTNIYQIIGLTGEAGSGKTTIAFELADQYKINGYQVEVINFADALKEDLSTMLDIPLHHFYINGPIKESLRPIMQWYGTEFCRNETLGLLLSKDFHNNYWVSRMKEKIEQISNEFYPKNAKVVIIIADVRFNNEADMIAGYDTVCESHVVKVDAYGHKTTEHNGHASENGVSNELIDVYFENNHNKGMQNLQYEVKRLFDIVRPVTKNNE